MENNVEDRFNSFVDITIDLQRDILNLILNDRNFLINTLNFLDPEYFLDASHKNICSIAQNYFKQFNTSISQDILINEIKKKFENNNQLPRYLCEIDIIGERLEQACREKDYLYKKVVEFSRSQAMRKAILECVPLIDDPEKYNEIDNLIKKARLVAPEVSLGSDLFEDVDIRYQKLLAELEGDKFTTCFPTIDQILTGGIGRKEVGMIFANSGVGKSVWCAQVAITNMIQGKNVLYISCEMSEDRILERADSMLTKIPIHNIRNRYLDVKERLKMLQSNIQTKLKVKEFPAGASGMQDFKIFAHQLYNYQNFRPDLVVLDYLDEVKFSNSRWTSYEGQYMTLKEFRAWMMEENICGITATQANRTGRQVKIITEGELGDSYAKIRVVDACWSLNQDDEEKNKNIARLFAVKHRNARSKFIIPLKQDSSTLTFKQISENEYENILGGTIPANVVTENNL